MSRKPGEQIKLAVVIKPTGMHVAGWRREDALAGDQFAHHKRFVETAEKACFDAVFLADGPGMATDNLEVASRSSLGDGFEPVTLLSALSAVTSRIGLIATASSTYSEPYHVARQFASLDILSGGRAGLNLVTTQGAAAAFNFGKESHLEHARRYERAEEFFDVLEGLWDSWEHDAFVHDRASGLYFDPAKLHVLNHKGPHFSVRGPLNVARPVQGHPVKVQAGSSEAGRELAARGAEIVFTLQQTLQEGQSFYADVKNRAQVKYGRNPDHLKIMPGVVPFVGRSEAEARDKQAQLQALLHPVPGLKKLSDAVGFDLSGYPLDGPLPDLPESDGSKGMQQVVTQWARRENLTLRELYQRVAGSFGHRTIFGTAQSIADQLEEWFIHDAADGFNIMFPYLPGGLDDFVELVIPELRRRGLFRQHYEGRTLREHLGLPYPQHPAGLPALQSA